MVKTIINHPPVITIFIGGMVTIPRWLVYDFVLTTVHGLHSERSGKRKTEGEAGETQKGPRFLVKVSTSRHLEGDKDGRKCG